MKTNKLHTWTTTLLGLLVFTTSCNLTKSVSINAQNGETDYSNTTDTTGVLTVKKGVPFHVKLTNVKIGDSIIIRENQSDIWIVGDNAKAPINADQYKPEEISEEEMKDQVINAIASLKSPIDSVTINTGNFQNGPLNFFKQESSKDIKNLKEGIKTKNQKYF